LRSASALAYYEKGLHAVKTVLPTQACQLITAYANAEIPLDTRTSYYFSGDVLEAASVSARKRASRDWQPAGGETS